MDKVSTPSARSVNRRSFIKSAAALGISATVAPFAIGRERPVVRVLGTHVTLQEALRKRAMEDLGIELHFEPKGSAALLQKASMNPSSFDLYEQWSNSINVLWRSKAIQPIEKKRLIYWDEINGLTKTGKITRNARMGAGDAPHKILHIQADGTLGTKHTDKLSFLPYVHNVDSFGYNTALLDDEFDQSKESWGWLLDSRLSGKVGIVNDPTIGLFDLALAAEAKGFLKFKDMGAITNQELDELFTILIELKQLQHFSGFWTSVPESMHFMRSQRVHIESMFSPAVSALNGENIPVRFAAPVEGYRGWHGVMCLSSSTTGRVKDACYEYMNWWLSGWPGAFIARQGYYISNPSRSAKFLSKAEWDYWYQGLPAAEDLRGPNGKISVKKGQQRSGGSYEDRFSNVAVWNTVMPSYEYSLQKWYEFITS
ncbi:ABC transporter substrate-binding protein [Alteromonas sp. ASW11-130]|uniref:ABC transporter substrate-binding protein n=1 Tax=Alteromonas sp. ASW11-130 TaxID=3015775 RepID=UPI0022422C85|nr:extracellular solute-binding protein [Alteromonas sp. ASW11-130]MCW8091736.1 extracellular solute-binding protein [Alteromonas sp. ASW11-130]